MTRATIGADAANRGAQNIRRPAASYRETVYSVLGATHGKREECCCRWRCCDLPGLFGRCVPFKVLHGRE